MKRKESVLIVIVLGISLLISCSKEKPIVPDTPANTLLILTSAINADNYDSFNALFSDGRKDTVSEEMFSEFNSMTAPGSAHSLYGVITYSNGEMLLARLSVIKTDGKYKIEDVVKIPDEMKKLFLIK